MPYNLNLDYKRLEDKIFDDISSKIHKQCHTVLQILRSVMRFIDDDMAAWDKTKGEIIRCRGLLQWSIAESSDRKQSLEDQLKIVTELLSSQTKQLKDRVERKTEDVKSLREEVGPDHWWLTKLFCYPVVLTMYANVSLLPNQLFNIISLRVAEKSLVAAKKSLAASEQSLAETKISVEIAKKGTALNRAIYMFTIVTIIYTPLGFMAVGPKSHMPSWWPVQC